jgi:sugar O-acyltransferase (sialic acid O-acetyltransferase NeuD family)
MDESAADVYVFAATGFARIIAGYLDDDPRYDFKGYVITKEYVQSETVYGRPLLAYEENKAALRQAAIINCIGYNKMMSTREMTDKMLIGDGMPLGSYVHRTARIMQGASIGEHCLIMAHTYIGEYARLGGSNIVWPSAHIEHDVISGDYNFFAAQSLVLGGVTIGDHCFIGGNAAVKNNVNLADYSLIGAGAVIAGDTDAFGVYAPQRTVKIGGKSSLEIDI